jgi:hypothetical protein
VSYASLKTIPLVFGPVYFASFIMSWTFIYYYPETSTFYWQAHPDDGPAILWYGWLVNGALASLAAAVIVPRRLADRLPNRLVALAPVLLTVAILIYESRWFL